MTLSRSVGLTASNNLRPTIDWEPTASTKVLDAFATSKSVVRNATGSGARCGMDKGAGNMFASAADPRSIYLGATVSLGWDFIILYD